MTIGDMPRAEVEVDSAVVRALLRSQHPDLADRDLHALAAGWDNFMFRLGDDLAVRLPRRQASAQLIENEQRWLPELARQLPLPIPAPVRIGRPGPEYPWSWSVCPWLEGEPAAMVEPDDLTDTAISLGKFLVALHRPAPRNAPRNPVRGVPLETRDAAVLDRISSLDGVIEGPRVKELWEALRGTPISGEPPLWLHGDLHPANLLISDGRLAAVVDFGDLTAGDRATDLSVAWMLFPEPVRPIFREAAGGCDDATWHRARGWALALSLAYLAFSGDNPTMGRLGSRTINAVLGDAVVGDSQL